jgi:hypothetical protein
MIEPLPKPVRDYLAGFNLGCIAVSSTGDIQVVGSNHLARTSSVVALWWTQDRATAHQVVRAGNRGAASRQRRGCRCRDSCCGCPCRCGPVRARRGRGASSRCSCPAGQEACGRTVRRHAEVLQRVLSPIPARMPAARRGCHALQRRPGPPAQGPRRRCCWSIDRWSNWSAYASWRTSADEHHEGWTVRPRSRL